ncbi:MAG: CheR family methyltransferase [Halomonas sp.]
MSRADGALSPADHRRVASFIEREAGIHLPEHKRHLIEVRLRKRQRETGRQSLHDYLNFALSPAGEATEQLALIDAITTNKTDFFREPAHFEFLCDYLASTPGAGRQSPLRLWSAACSSGEEPYTLAMVLHELSERLDGLTFHVDASDIAPSVLETARRAVYPAARVEPVPMALRRKYLLRSNTPGSEQVKMGPALRRAVSFAPFNLLTGHYPDRAGYDAIFCRNVMIYFGEAERRQVIAQLHGALRPGGLLFIGHSESLGRPNPGFEPLIPSVYRKREPRG